MSKALYVFVYGTLRRGERADLARSQKAFDAEFICKDEINGRIYHLGAFPGVKTEAYDAFDPSAPRIIGEVFLIKTPALMSILDHYEGYDEEAPDQGLYNRVEVRTKGGYKVWVYTYNHPVTDEQRIETGDWKNPRTTINHKRLA